MEYLNATLAWETAVPLAEQVWVTLINEPAHLIVEGILAVLVLLLIFQRSYRIPKSVGPAPLTESVRNHSYYAVVWIHWRRVEAKMQRAVSIRCSMMTNFGA